MHLTCFPLLTLVTFSLDKTIGPYWFLQLNGEIFFLLPYFSLIFYSVLNLRVLLSP